jgi:integrase
MANETSLVPLSPAAELAGLAVVAQEAFDAARAAHTRATYARQWARFCAFAARFGAAPCPASPALVVAWLASLVQAGVGAASLGVAAAAVAAAHADAGHASPTDHPTVRKFLRGRTRLGAGAHAGGPSGKPAMLLEPLRRLIAATPPTARGARDRAMLLLGWWGALRRSELVALDAADVVPVEQGLELWIRGAKRQIDGRPRLKPVPYASDPKLCPVRALARWREVSGITAGPLFVALDAAGRLRAPLAPGAVRAIVRRHAEAAGLRGAGYAAHSLRSGFATVAARARKPVKAIQEHLHHATPEMTLRYVQRVEVWDEHPGLGLA